MADKNRYHLISNIDQSDIDEILTSGYTERAPTEYKYDLTFLDCICGGKPYILHFKDGMWGATCPKCHISTVKYSSLERLRASWNRHASYGQIHQGISKEKYAVTRNLNEKKRKELHALKAQYMTKAQVNLDLLSYWYAYDDAYLCKIQNTLKKDMCFKSYPHLCTFLNEQMITQPSSRKKHIEHWKRFFDFDRSPSTHFIVTKIFDNYIPWSGSEEIPNKGRSYRSFKPTPMDIGREERVAFTHKTYVKAQAEIKKIEKLKQQKEKYEINEDDLLYDEAGQALQIAGTGEAEAEIYEEDEYLFPDIYPDNDQDTDEPDVIGEDRNLEENIDENG